MSNESHSSSGARPGDDAETGEPIHALKELGQVTSPLFLTGVRRKIHRRTTASQLLSFSWQLPKMAFVELANMAAHILNALNIRKGD